MLLDAINPPDVPMPEGTYNGEMELYTLPSDGTYVFAGWAGMTTYEGTIKLFSGDREICNVGDVWVQNPMGYTQAKFEGFQGEILKLKFKNGRTTSTSGRSNGVLIFKL